MLSHTEFFSRMPFSNRMAIARLHVKRPHQGSHPRGSLSATRPSFWTQHVHADRRQPRLSRSTAPC